MDNIMMHGVEICASKINEVIAVHMNCWRNVWSSSKEKDHKKNQKAIGSGDRHCNLYWLETLNKVCIREAIK